MWTYEQSTGRLFDPDGAFCAQGYSGGGTDPGDSFTITGKNNPKMQDREFMGPLPVGIYTIQAPVNTVTHGPYVLPLTPEPSNEMFGRDAFLIHGDSIVWPGFASDGCVIQSYNTRIKIWESGDHRIQVVGKMVE